jgi:hypothetical protein
MRCSRNDRRDAGRTRSRPGQRWRDPAYLPADQAVPAAHPDPDRPLAALTGAGRDDTGPDVVLKLEQLQCAGSFKTRGAFANLLLREIPPAGVVAASGA